MSESLDTILRQRVIDSLQDRLVALAAEHKKKLDAAWQQGIAQTVASISLELASRVRLHDNAHELHIIIQKRVVP